jgi:hypothetical protein
MTVQRDGAPDPLRAGPVELAVPEGWEQQPTSDADALLVAPASARRGFRANAVVTSRPSAGSPRAHLGDLLLGGAAAGRVLAVEPFPRIGAVGRRIEAVYLVDRTAVRTTTWATTADGRDVEVTLSRPLLPSEAVFDAVDRITASLVVHGGADDDDEPAPEVPAGRQLGAPRAFPPITGDAWRLLWRSAGHGFQPGAARSPEGRELRDAGLMTAFGGTTPDAELFLRIAQHARRGTIRRSDADGEAIRSVWSAEGEVAVDVGRIEGEPALVVTHSLSIEPAGSAALRLLDWVGVTPTGAWGGEEHAEVLDEAVSARLHGSTPPLDGAGPALASAWRAAGWSAFDIGSDGTPAVLRVLRGGDGTWWLQGPVAEDGTTRLRALASTALIDVLTGGGPAL